MKLLSINRQLDGILLLDKPSGYTSNFVLQNVKRIYNANKAGHTGSLDPIASGLLPICFGKATKFAEFLINADKSYKFTCKLGEITSTGDADGQIIERRPINEATVNVDYIKNLIKSFTGKISQIPPMYSAVKHRGQPLYKLARLGIVIERLPRTVTIHKFNLIRFENLEIECEVNCSKGTYIRTLVTNLGEALGCGAHVTMLRRTSVGNYSSSDMVTLSMLNTQSVLINNFLLPIDNILLNLPKKDICIDNYHHIKNGQSINVQCNINGLVRLYHNSKFIGLGNILGNILIPKCII